MSALKKLDFALFPLDDGCILIADVYSLMRLANSLRSSSSSLSLSLSSSHTFVLPFALRHMGGGGSNGSSLVREMVTMSSSSLDSSLDETSVTHSYFSTKKQILANFALRISPWPEHLSFRVKIVTPLVDLVAQACELSHHEGKFSIIIFIIGCAFLMMIFFIAWA